MAIAKKLTPKQKMFCQEYLVDLNGSAAAARAGYSKRRAKQIGYGLLRKANVKQAIQKLMDARGKKLEVTHDQVLQEIARIAFANLSDFVDIDDAGAIRVKTFDEMPEMAARVLQCVSEDRIIRESEGGKQVLVHDKRKIKLHDKMKALELLARHLKLLTDKVEFPDKDGNPQDISGVLTNTERAVRLTFLIKKAMKAKNEHTLREEKAAPGKSSRAKIKKKA